jgi:hypothetical protein
MSLDPRATLTRSSRDVAGTLGRDPDVEVRRVAWDDKQPTFRTIRHARRVEVAHGRLGRRRRLAKSFENTTTSATGCLRVACIADAAPPVSRAGPPTPTGARRLTGRPHEARNAAEE